MIISCLIYKNLDLHKIKKIVLLVVFCEHSGYKLILLFLEFRNYGNYGKLLTFCF